jgi:membrane fusion protein, multidrug efflux system
LLPAQRSPAGKSFAKVSRGFGLSPDCRSSVHLASEQLRPRERSLRMSDDPALKGIYRVGTLLPGALVLGLAACSAPPPSAPKLPPNFAVMKVRAGDIPITASLSGDIEAQVEQDLSFRVGGQIASLAVDVGDHVKKGDVLAHIDPQELQANADLAAASVTSAQAQLTQAQANDTRQQSLLTQGNTTRANVDSADAALAAATSALKSAQAQAASAKEQLSYAELEADADGIVVARSAEVGQVVQAAQPVFTEAVDGPRDAVFQAYERALAGVQRNAPVTISLLTDPGVKATGHVREYSPTLDSATGTVRIKVGLDPGSPDMPLGAAVNGTVALPPRHGFALPWRALFRDANGPAVWLVDPATDTVALKPVIVDRLLDSKVIVSSGLTDGETIVAKGLQLLRPGEKITPQEAAP